MAKQYVVARGQIEDGKKVLARRGERYTPKNTAERDRLLSRGVIVEPRPAKAATDDGASDADTGSDTGMAGAGGGGAGEGPGA